MSTIGDSSIVVTLTPALRNVTVTGTVDAFGPAGTYVSDIGPLTGSHTFDAAIFGPAGSTVFTIVNENEIISNGTSDYGAGILLGGAGTITNAGTITAADGIAIFGAATGAEVINTKLIDATLGFGVYLHAGGEVENKAELIAGTLGIALGGGGTVTNSGTIKTTNRYGYGIVVAGGNADYVHNTGIIDAGIFFPGEGILLAGTGAVENSGTIDGSYGIRLTEAGTVTNTGVIFGGEADAIALNQGGTINDNGYLSAAIGIFVFGGAGQVHTAGTIRAEGGIYLTEGGTLTNAASIIAINGINLTGGTAINTGLIDVSNYGAIMKATSPTLDNSGRILAGAAGVLAAAGGTIIDTGTISGSHYAISFASGAGSRLIISATASFGGTVQLNGGALEFAADGKTIGTFAPEDMQILNAGSITIDTGSIWDISGTFTNGSDGILINDGTLKEGATDLVSFNGPIEGKGLIELGKKPLTVESTVAATQKLQFTGTGEALLLGDAQAFDGKIEKFAIGDTIGLTGIPLGSITGTHFAGGILTLDDSGHTIKLSFSSPASFGNDVFVLTADGLGTEITLKKPAMAILSPTVPPEPPTLLPPIIAPGTTMTATPDPLAGMTMFVPAHLAAAAYVRHPAPASLPAITLQP